jgi:C4-dicarboxylate transporter, DctM subunit
VQNGYPPRFGAGVIATSGALGILFPPSINLVIFAVATSGMQPKGRPVPLSIRPRSVNCLLLGSCPA